LGSTNRLAPAVSSVALNSDFSCNEIAPTNRQQRALFIIIYRRRQPFIRWAGLGFKLCY